MLSTFLIFSYSTLEPKLQTSRTNHISFSLSFCLYIICLQSIAFWLYSCCGNCCTKTKTLSTYSQPVILFYNCLFGRFWQSYIYLLLYILPLLSLSLCLYQHFHYYLFNLCVRLCSKVSPSSSIAFSVSISVCVLSYSAISFCHARLRSIFFLPGANEGAPRRLVYQQQSQCPFKRIRQPIELTHLVVTSESFLLN